MFYSFLCDYYQLFLPPQLYIYIMPSLLIIPVTSLCPVSCVCVLCAAADGPGVGPGLLPNRPLQGLLPGRRAGPARGREGHQAHRDHHRTAGAVPRIPRTKVSHWKCISFLISEFSPPPPPPQKKKTNIKHHYIHCRDGCILLIGTHNARHFMTLYDVQPRILVFDIVPPPSLSGPTRSVWSSTVPSASSSATCRAT